MASRIGRAVERPARGRRFGQSLVHAGPTAVRVPRTGSLVRYLWNAAAVVQMYWYGLGWGGSLAFKTKLLRETDLRQSLASAFTDDIATTNCARRHGYRVAFVRRC